MTNNAVSKINNKNTSYGNRETPTSSIQLMDLSFSFIAG